MDSSCSSIRGVKTSVSWCRFSDCPQAVSENILSLNLTKFDMNWAFRGPADICGMYVVVHPWATEADESDFVGGVTHVRALL